MEPWGDADSLFFKNRKLSSSCSLSRKLLALKKENPARVLLAWLLQGEKHYLTDLPVCETVKPRSLKTSATFRLHTRWRTLSKKKRFSVLYGNGMIAQCYSRIQNTHSILQLVRVDTTAAPGSCPRSVYCRSIAFLLVVWLFEIYRFIRKIFTYIAYNRWDKYRKRKVPCTVSGRFTQLWSKHFQFRE